MVVDDVSVDEMANDVSDVVEVGDVVEIVEVGDVFEVVEVGNGSVSGTAEEGFKAVDVGAASVVDKVSGVDTAKEDSELFGVELAAAMDGEMPARVEE